MSEPLDMDEEFYDEDVLDGIVSSFRQVNNKPVVVDGDDEETDLTTVFRNFAKKRPDKCVVWE